MAQSLSAKRLRKELLALQRDPVENITARPLESNILVWHYVLKGKGSRALGVRWQCHSVQYEAPRSKGRGGHDGIDRASFLPSFLSPPTHPSTQPTLRQAPRARPTKGATTTGSSSFPPSTP